MILERKYPFVKHKAMHHSLSTVELFKHVNAAECVELTSEQLKDLQNVLLSILRDIDMFCRENNIRYYLGGGTALGAVRHHGFIPWDDDVDINIPRKDYKRFIELFPKKMGGKYWLHTPENTKDYGLLLARVRLKGTCVKTREDFFNEECGAFVDIFTVDNVPDDPLLQGIHGFISMALGFLLSCRKFYRERKPLKKLLEGSQDCEQLQFTYNVKIILGFFTAILPISTWVHLNHWWNGLCRDENSRLVTVPSGKKHYWGESISRYEIFPTVPRKFESCEFFTAKTDLYLKKMYGDYMQIPPMEERETHILFRPFDLGPYGGKKRDRFPPYETDTTSY